MKINSFQECNASHLFENIKEGDILGFWMNGIFASIIQYFQQKQFDDDTNKICHVGIVYDVARKVIINNADGYLEITTFRLGEQTGQHGGLLSTWQIEKYKTAESQNFQYIICKDTKYRIMYLRSFNSSLTPEQIKIGIEDQEKEVGKKYGFVRLPISIPFISSFIGKYFNKNIFIPWFSKSRVCSGNVWVNMLKAGRISSEEFAENPAPTPEFVCCYDKNNCKGILYKITNFSKLLHKSSNENQIFF